MKEESRGEIAGRLFDEHGEALYRFLNRLCLNRAEAEDLAVETILACCGSWATFRRQSSERTYVLRVGLNRWRRWVRSRMAQETESSLPIAAPDLELRIDLDRAIGALSPELRESFVLVKAEGLTHRQAADVLRLPTGTVQARVFRACRQLRQILDDLPNPLGTVSTDAGK